WRGFLNDIKSTDVVVKDQWEFQMHARVLEKVGQDHLFFITDGISLEDMKKIYINPAPVGSGQVEKSVQDFLNKAQEQGKSVAVIPEGPYCAPLA
ncbi:hypothetical protein JW926_12855, partial [Candidatus Sumerlaeota bacterium]|nr:hypothetical protein [Candidatus Sumerlaeota bacterium]